MRCLCPRDEGRKWGSNSRRSASPDSKVITAATPEAVTHLTPGPRASDATRLPAGRPAAADILSRPVHVPVCQTICSYKEDARPVHCYETLFPLVFFSGHSSVSSAVSPPSRNSPRHDVYLMEEVGHSQLHIFSQCQEVKESYTIRQPVWDLNTHRSRLKVTRHPSTTTFTHERRVYVRMDMGHPQWVLERCSTMLRQPSRQKQLIMTI